MILDPQSMRATSYQQWSAGNPPQPNGGERVDIWGEDPATGDVWHKWYDGTQWSGWENLGHP